jgi:hypothetical protein
MDDRAPISRLLTWPYRARRHARARRHGSQPGGCRPAANPRTHRQPDTRRHPRQRGTMLAQQDARRPQRRAGREVFLPPILMFATSSPCGLARSPPPRSSSCGSSNRRSPDSGSIRESRYRRRTMPLSRQGPTSLATRTPLLSQRVAKATSDRNVTASGGRRGAVRRAASPRLSLRWGKGAVSRPRA